MPALNRDICNNLYKNKRDCMNMMIKLSQNMMID